MDVRDLERHLRWPILGLSGLVACLMILGAASVVREKLGEQSGDYVRGAHVRAIDGDTVVWPGGERVRIWNIDTPEIGRAKCERERALGLQAKARLQALLNRSHVYLARCEPGTGRCQDRHGRTLGAITSEHGDLGEILVKEGLAVRYRRGARMSWCEGL